MKQNPDYILREVAGAMVLVPVGEASRDFPGMITMNPTGVYLWEQLACPQTAESLTRSLVERYEVTADVAKKDVDKFLHTMTVIGAVIE